MKSDLQIIVELRQKLGRDPTREEIGDERTRLGKIWHDETQMPPAGAVQHKDKDTEPP